MRSVASSDADRLTAFLRVVAVPVVLIGEAVSSAEPKRGSTVLLIAGLLAVHAVVVVGVVRRDSRPAAFDVVLPALDTAFAVGLGLASGGAFSLLFLVFLFAPATTAFQQRPRLTVAVTVLSVSAYLGQALAYASESSQEGAVGLAFVRTLYLAWIGAVLVSLSVLLARRERRLADALAVRTRLVQQTLDAEARAAARLAADLHDGVLQSLLAVRYTVLEAAEGVPSLSASAATLGEVVAQIRGVIGDLHPSVLEHLRLAAALSALVRRAGKRAPAIRFALDADPAASERRPHDLVLYRCASELVANTISHAQASEVRVRLRREPDSDELLVADDGVGFDPAILEQRLREGHIGLLAVRERIEGVGGILTITPTPGGGSTVRVRVTTRETELRHSP